MHNHKKKISRRVSDRRVYHGIFIPACSSLIRKFAVLSVAACCSFCTLHTTNAEENLITKEEVAWQAAVAVVENSVVQIRLVGGLETVDKQLLGTGPTTGLIITEDGYILSSAYQFAQRPSSILVILSDGQRLPAKLVASDHSRMLVLLKVEPTSPLPVPPMAEKGTTKVGAWAIAIGRTYRADAVNTSVGIVSALGRMKRRALQTDAKISAVNYGGPLVNLRGQVLGLLVPMSPGAESAVAGTQWYDSGVGFAIPSWQIRDALPRLKKGEDLFPGRLGISLGKDQNKWSAPIVDAVQPKSPADKAGLLAKDKILTVGGEKTETATQLHLALGHHYAGDSIAVEVERESKTVKLTADLTAKLPAQVKEPETPKSE